MRAWVFSLAVLLAAVPAARVTAAQAGTGDAAALAKIHQFVDGFNKGDVRSALAACASEAAIIDDFPPHRWQGSGACSKWFDAFAAYDKAQGITGDFVALGNPKVAQVSGSYAYVVLPASYRYKQHGKPVVEDGATFTVALQKMSGAWRITGWAWAQ